MTRKCIMLNIWNAFLLTALLLLALLPVEQRLSSAHTLALWMVFAGSAMGMALLTIKGSHFKCTMADAALIAYGLWLFLRCYFGNEFSCGTQVLQYAVFYLIYCFLRLSFSVKLPSQDAIVLVIAGFGLLESFIGMGQIVTGSSRNGLYPVTGNFLNPGPYSASLMLALSVGVVYWQRLNVKRNASRIFNIVFVAAAIMLAVLLCTFSRAAFAGLLLVVLLSMRHYYHKYRFVLWTMVVLAAIVLFCAKQGSACGRLAIWWASATSWLHSPWTGVGIGGFPWACGNGMAEVYSVHPDSFLFRSAGVTDNAYNIIIQIAVEQGLAGVALFVVWVAAVMFRLYRQSKPLFYGMLAMLVFAMFSYPFSQLPYLLITALILAWSNSQNNDSVAGSPWQRALLCLAFLLCSAMAWLTKAQVSGRLAADKSYSLFAGLQSSAFINDFYELLPSETDNPRFLFDFGITLRHSHRFRDSNAMLRKGSQVSADPMFYVVMGNNYAYEGLMAEARQSYLHAFAMMPNRLYPLYQLMKLYESTENKVQARAIALRIVRLKEKVPSPATAAMRKKALQILKTH